MTRKKRQARGIKRSSMLKIQRQLLLIRCLGRQPTSADDLIRQVNILMPEAYPSAAKAAFRHDLRTLREEFSCDIYYHTTYGYELRSVGDLALLELSQDAMRGLRYLDAQFPLNTTVPDHAYARTLIDEVIELIPPERRGELNTAEPMLDQVGPQVVYDYDPSVVNAIRRALKSRRELAFRYRPSLRPGEEYHRVAPRNIFTRDSHLYLLAYCFDGPNHMIERVGGYADYRVDYIVSSSAEVLPDVLPSSLPQRRIWSIRYELTPEVAKNKHIAHWFANTSVTYTADGSAIVCADVHNLWQACQILLRYMGACKVLEPPELVTLMCDAAQHILKQYE